MALTAVALAEGEGIRVDRLDDTSLADAEPAITGEVADAWLVHSGHRLHSGALTVALALDARARGVMVRHHLHARALARRGDRVVGAVTDDGLIEASTTVVAGGPWSYKLLDPVGVSFADHRRQRLAGPARSAAPAVPTTSCAPSHPSGHRQGLAPDRPLVREIPGGRPSAERDRDHVGSPIETVLVLLVGAIPVRSGSHPNPTRTEVVRRMLAEAVRLAPSLEGGRRPLDVVGVRPLSPDERPFVGPVLDGLAVATGHGSEGVILGAGSAILLASQLAGEDVSVRPGTIRAPALRLSSRSPAGALHDPERTVHRHREQDVTVAPHRGLGGERGRSRRPPACVHRRLEDAAERG